MTGTNLAATERPTLPTMSKMELANERAMQASAELDNLCLSECNLEFALVPFDGDALKQMTDRGAMSEDEMVTWVAQHAPLGCFRTREKKIRLVTLLLKENNAIGETGRAMDDVLKEDRGWPHRMAVYHDRCAGIFKRGKRDPQRWFLSCGDGIRAIQEGSDPDRYVPNTPHDKLTIVGTIMERQLRFDTDLDANMTVGSVTKDMALRFGFDPNHSVLGFHNRPIHDKDLNLMDFGILPGTLLHIAPGWATVEAMEQAIASSDANENATIKTER